MAIDSKRFPLQNAIKKILAYPKSRPELPVLEDGSSVGDDNFGEADRYDTGKWPDIALNDENVVVEVHQSQNHDTLWYHVGKVEGNKIAWRESIEYDEGLYPSVAITNDGLVVEVHESQNRDTLWYHVGRVNGDTIKWGDSIEYDDGVQPSVAITNDGLVVEVHKSENYDKLYYHVGRVNGETIEWGESIQYDDGVQPSVAITNDGLVVEVHKSQSHDTLWYHIGKVEGDKISWRNDGKSTEYGNGKGPKVACNGMLAVETHQEGSDKLLCSVLTLPAFRSNWIELHGENSYCYCACNSATKDKQRHASNNTMNVKEGAPYFYAVLTKDDDSIDFPTGAILTIQGPDGTKYDRDIEEENKLVIMSGSSVRCLIVKDPKPGDWKMTMTVPEGVGFHCECNTVPSKDVYETITETLNSPKAKTLQPRNFLGLALWGFIGLAIALMTTRTKASETGSELMLNVVAAGVDVHPDVAEAMVVDLPELGVASNTSIFANSSETAASHRQNPRTVVRFTTWNMQGRTNLPYLSPLVQRSPDEDNYTLIQILALQETGNLLDSNNFTNRRPLLAPNGGTLGNIANREMNGNFMEFLYWENEWAQGGMAIATNIHRGQQGVLEAVNVNSFIPRNTRNLPWATVQIPSNNQHISLTIYTIHAPPVYGPVTVDMVRQWVAAQISQITQREGNNRWILLGDFNLTPEQLGNIPGVHVVRGNYATHQNGELLDYAVTNEGSIRSAPQGNVLGASDHYPAVFEWEQP